MGITKEQYEAAIPKCCAYQTIEAHESIMLCWGLAAAVERGEKMNCDNCTENTMKVGDDGTATKSLRETTDEDFDVAHELPNVEVTGAARPHRAASRERSERGRP